MTFLNPAILWGLSLISIPILIHLFNLRRTKKIEFSTLMFLREIQQTKYKKIKLKQLLILLCRILMIIFLVLAFAAPFEKGYISHSGEKVRSTVLLVIDDSFSMLATSSALEVKSDSGNAFNEAKRKLIQTINILNEQDEIYFTTASKLGRPGEKIFYDNKDALIDSINNCKVSMITHDLDYIMFYSNQILNSSSNPFKEFFFFTDGQKSTFANQFNSTGGVSKNDNVEYNLILCGKRKANNISIDTINIISKIFQKGKPIKLNCTVTNHNNFNAVNTTLSLHLEEDKKGREEKVIDIPSNSSVNLDFSFIPETMGWGGGYIELTPSNSSGLPEDDEILSDNKRYFSYRIPDKINLLTAFNKESDIEYIRLSLASSEELSKDSASSRSTYFNIKQIHEDNLLNELNDANNKFDCILISNKKSFNDQEASNIYGYVQRGGGLLIYPGDNSDYINYNNVLFKKFDLSGINGTFGGKSENELLKFEKVDLEHPVFDGIFNTKEDNINGFIKESPSIKYGFNLTSSMNAIPLIKLNNERNFMVEYTSGKGKIIFFAVAPDMNYSDFPAKNIFPPITVRSILYLSNINLPKEAITGNDYFIDPETYKLSEKDTLYISNAIESNRLMNIPLENKQNILNLKNYINNTTNYKLSYSKNNVMEFPCNFDKRESIPDKLNESELLDLFKTRYKLKPNIISPDKDYTPAILQLRTGRELWKYMLIIALIFLMAEFIISKLMVKKQVVTG